MSCIQMNTMRNVGPSRICTKDISQHPLILLIIKKRQFDVKERKIVRNLIRFEERGTLISNRLKRVNAKMRIHD